MVSFLRTQKKKKKKVHINKAYLCWESRIRNWRLFFYGIQKVELSWWGTKKRSHNWRKLASIYTFSSAWTRYWILLYRYYILHLNHFCQIDFFLVFTRGIVNQTQFLYGSMHPLTVWNGCMVPRDVFAAYLSCSSTTNSIVTHWDFQKNKKNKLTLKEIWKFNKTSLQVKKSQYWRCSLVCWHSYNTCNSVTDTL